MAIDIRAVCTCSLGPLISANISDDYAQGNGLIRTKGSCEIAGLLAPRMGDPVSFFYEINGQQKKVPRALRVLSSFADPLRNVTKVELGDKFVLYADLKPLDKLQAKIKAAQNEDSQFTEEERKIVTEPIKALEVVTTCLAALNIDAKTIPLTNKFSVEEFDLTPGYVQVLNDILVSEGVIGYIDASQEVECRFIKLYPNSTGGEATVITADNIIDISPIGVGQLPADLVLVNYNTLKLKTNINTQDNDLWQYSRSSNTTQVGVTYTKSGPALEGDEDGQGATATRIYQVLTETFEDSYFTEIKTTDQETKVVPDQRIVVERTGAAALLGAQASEFLSNNIPFAHLQVEQKTYESFRYDSDGNETLHVTEQYAALPYIYGSANVPWVFSRNDYVTVPYDIVKLVRRTEVITDTIGDYQRVETRIYGQWAETIEGQQAVAASGQQFTNSNQVTQYLNKIFSDSLYLLSVNVVTRTRQEPQSAPSLGDRIRGAHANRAKASPNNNYSTPSVSETAFSRGTSSAVGRTLDLNMPYAPDDTFISFAGGYTSKPSDAPLKAANFGRLQNHFLNGNRCGVNIQVAVSTMPEKPLSPLSIVFNGVAGLFFTNATTWTMDANGIVASADCLYWGGIGSSPGGVSWISTAPNVALPPAPPIVNGKMQVTTIVPPWTETLYFEGNVIVGLAVERLNGLAARLNNISVTILTTFDVVKVVELTPPVTDIAITAPVPALVTAPPANTVVAPPSADIAIAALVPAFVGEEAPLG